jgi:hypothetical protein
MNITTIRQAIASQADKVNQLKQELQEAETEQARLEDLEKKLNLDYQEKITQAAELLRQAQLLAGCDQEAVISSVCSEMDNQDKEEEQIINNEPSELELTALRLLKEQLALFTQLNSALPEEEQLENKRTLLAVVDGGIKEPVNPEIVDPELEEMKQEIKKVMCLVTLPELKKIAAISGLYSQDTYQLLESHIDVVGRNEIKELIVIFLEVAPATKVFFDKFNKPALEVVKSVEHKDIPLEELQLSTNTYNLISRQQVNTIADLMLYSESELLQIRGIGQKALNEIKEQLKNRLGIAFDSELQAA